jgi:4-hydroxy-tetrahydrodipicolinate synthase
MFEGVLVAIVTPFTRDGAVDEAAFRRLIDHLIENGVNGIVPCGTTGESPALTHDEHRRVTEICIEQVAGRVPVVAGTGSNSTHEAVDLTKHAHQAGADGVLMVAPYYNKPTPEGVYQHYKTVADAAPIPIIVYNIPGRTGLNIMPETMARLAEIDNIVGVKEATGSLAQMTQTVEACGPDFVLLSGDDNLTLPLMAVGGRGVISVVGQVVPAKMAEMVRTFLDGDWLKAREIHYQLLPLMRAMFFETNPIPVKTALAMMGMIEREYRLPMCPMHPDNEARLTSVLYDFGLVK